MTKKKRLNWKRLNWKRASLSLSVLLIALAILYSRLSRLGYAIPFSQLSAVLCWRDCDPQETPRFHVPLPADERLNAEEPIAQVLDVASLKKEDISILIEKSRYRLTLYHQQQPVKSYPVVFGGNPVGDKLQEGDRRTPEGIFKIRDLYPHEAWSKFIWLDYPNEASWKKHLAAKRQRKILQSASIGGEIGIHGVPAGTDSSIDRRNNWTLGCISLKNADVDEIYGVLQVGTTVEIVP